MEKKRLEVIIIAAILVFLLVVFYTSTHPKILLFISEQFPQIPIKPLGMVSNRPFHQQVELDSLNGKIVGDLFIPVDPGKKSAVIMAMGIKTADQDKPLLLRFADTMARLGYVTFWPRLKVLDEGISLPEEPETFTQSFDYLSNLPSVNPQKVSFIGFSVGSSLSMVSAQDPQIRNKVWGFVFFGGYFDVFDYFISLATKTTKLDDQTIPWNPKEDALNHAKGLLEARNASSIIKIFEATSAGQASQIVQEASQEEVLGMKRYSPKEKLGDFKAKIFILHDKSDTYVPYTQSIELFQALPKGQIAAYHISDLFEHVQPSKPINIGELIKLYGFLYQVLSFL